MSDDSWLGTESQEPTPGSGYGRTGGYDYGQSGQYPQQYAQQDPYAQDYAEQQQASYYSRGGQQQGGDWASQASGYPQQPPGSYPQTPPTAQAPQQPQYPQGAPQQGRGGQQQYARRPVPPAAPAADPYASGAYGRGTQDPSTSGTGYTQRGSYSGEIGAYPTAERDPRRETGAANYASGTYPASGGAPPRGRGAAPRPAQDGYPSGHAAGSFERPFNERDAYAAGAQPAVPGPGVSGPSAGGGGRRRAAAPPPPPGEFAEDEFAPRPRRSAGGRYEEDEFESTRGGGSRRGASDSREPRGDRDELGDSSRARRRPGASSGSGRDEDDERIDLLSAAEDDPDGRRSRGPGKAKRGLPCLGIFGVFVLIAGLLGYGGYSAYNWYQGKYGAPPDFASTTGTGSSVDVTVEAGSGGTTIGSLLFDAGIVASQRAFIAACDANTKCVNIQAGTYLLPKGISAATAVADMLNPQFQDSKTQLITYSGERAAQVFAALEQKTGWTDAAVRAAIAGGQVDLPSWDSATPGAKYPYARIEGFIAAESYDLKSYTSPTALLKKMVDDQLAVFTSAGLAAKAQSLGYSEYQILIIASMARAEAGSNPTDLAKISEVIYNRLKDPADFSHLGFDTTTLYGMGNSTTTPDNADSANRYNTSVQGIKGLPPGPIDNPDSAAVDAALNPTSDATLKYFCATPAGVQYADSLTAWNALGKKYPGLCGE